jgi:hypothetical protein
MMKLDKREAILEKPAPSHFAHLPNTQKAGTLRRKIVRILSGRVRMCLETPQLWASDKSVMRDE